MSGRWKEVTKSKPCPACEHDSWCGWDGQLLRCQRPGQSKCPPGMALRDEGVDYCLYGPEKHSTPKPRQQPVSSKAAPAALTDLARRFRSQVEASRLDSLAGELGVRPDALQGIGIGWATSADLKGLGAAWTGARPDGAWTFPEFNGDGQVCGISLRAPDGRKSSPSAKIGAHRGLIVPVDAELRPVIPEGLVLNVEGASDVAAALTVRLTAVGRPSNTGGAKDLAKLLAGREVLVLGENDPKQSGDWPGKEGAERVAADLAVAWNKAVRRALPPNGCKDLRAWLQARSRDGLSLQDAAACAAEGRSLLEGLISASKVTEPSGSKLLTRNLADVEPTQVEWLWFEKIPARKVSGIAGDPNLGKSAFTIDLAARVTRGTPWPDGSPCPMGSVLLLSAEDDPADTLRPRLEAAGGDPSRIVVIDGVIEEDGKRGFFDLSRDAALLERHLDENEDIRLILIDPLGAYLGATDENRNSQVRAVLGALSDLAGRRGITIVFVMHLNKASDMKALYRGSGSVAFTAAPRAFWLVAKDKQDPDKRLLLPVKVNLVREAKGIAFRLADAGGVPRVEWSNDEIKTTADEVLRLDRPAGAGTGKLEAAMAWLADLLEDGPVPEQEVKRAAADAGHSWGTVRRAKEELGLKPLKTGMRGPWVWSLEGKTAADPCADEGAQFPTHSGLSIFGGDEHLRREQASRGGPESPGVDSRGLLAEGAQSNVGEPGDSEFLPSRSPEDAQVAVVGADSLSETAKLLIPAEGAQPGCPGIEHLRERHPREAQLTFPATREVFHE